MEGIYVRIHFVVRFLFSSMTVLAENATLCLRHAFIEDFNFHPMLDCVSYALLGSRCERAHKCAMPLLLFRCPRQTRLVLSDVMLNGGLFCLVLSRVDSCLAIRLCILLDHLTVDVSPLIA
jgi:hypothetical protein